MGQVVPFITRVRDSGDWTAAERARLQELADRLAAGGVEVEAIFGATDEGDPWCVVTDGDGDVLIHVARIDGKFVVHSAVDDAVSESADLHVVLREHLAAAEEAMGPQSATILPFTARQGQTFLALVVAAAFFYETAGVAQQAEAAEAPDLSPLPEPPAGLEADQPLQERELAVQGSAQQQQPPQASALLAAMATPAPAATAAAPSAGTEPLPPPPVASAPVAHAATVEVAQPAAAEPALILGTADDDLIVGTAADERIVGGEGNDTLRGGGGNDILDGGAGDDRIELGEGVTAVGGEGADTFVIQAPDELGRSDTLLGVILDFGDAEGDRLIDWRGQTVDLSVARRRPTEESSDPSTDDGDDFTTTDVGDFGVNDFTTLVVGPPLTRIDVDLDGDGVSDGYVLVARKAAPADLTDPPIGVVGQSLGSVDPLA